MSFAELALIALGLSMDAFAVSVSDGLVMKRRSGAFAAAALFGLFQALMPAAGYLAGAGLAGLINEYDHFVVMAVLCFIGSKAVIESLSDIKEHRRGEKRGRSVQKITLPLLLAQAVATSIDALMAGVGFAAAGAQIVPCCAVIGAVTFALCVAGGLFGRRFGELLGAWAGFAGGTVLIAIGVKTAAEHMFFGA